MGRKRKNAEQTALGYELGLPEFIVTGKEEKGDDVLYTVSAKERPRCLNCGKADRMVIHSTSPVLVSDLPRFGKRVGLRIEKRRYTCLECNYVTPDSFESYEGRMTVRLRERIKSETLYRPFSKIANDYGFSSSKINDLFNEKIRECSKQYHPCMPDSLAIDTMPVHGGKAIYTVFIDLDSDVPRTVEISNATSQRAAVDCLNRLSNPRKCKRVFLAPKNEYRYAARTVMGRDIPLIVDRTHVIQEMYKSFDNIRLDISKRTAIKSRTRSFTSNRLLLTTDYEKLLLKQSRHLESLFKSYPEFQPAYELKEAFLNIYGADNAESAKAYYKEWKEACVSEGVTGYNGLIALIDSWYDEVFAYFDNIGEEEKISSAKDVILKIDREGYRYKFEVLRAKILYRNIETQPLAGKVDFSKFN